jgi:RHS repeat-associated protein
MSNFLGSAPEVNNYTYDHANRLIAMSGQWGTQTFTYDGLGNRVQQVVGTVTRNFSLDLAAPLTQVLTDGEFTYLYGINRIAQDGVNGREYFLSDALNSVRLLVDEDREITLRRDYKPFGLLDRSFGGGVTHFGFTGEWGEGYVLDGQTCGEWFNGIETDNCPTSGPLYLRARYYAPDLGRFLSRDVWEGENRNPLTLNRWNYVLANPVNFTDPTGKIPCLGPNLTDSLECAALFGFVPDYNGIFIVELFKQEFKNQEAYITAAGLHPTTIAAAIAVQSQWIDSPLNQFQHLYAEISKKYCLPDIPLIQKFLDSPGLGYAQSSDEFGDPYIMVNSIKAMTERIKPVVKECTNCKAKDKLIAGAMAQNGGFSYHDMAYVRQNKIKNPDITFGVEINWIDYFDDLSPLNDNPLDPYNNLRALWRTNFNTRFQLQLFTQDMMALHLLQWELPVDITVSDLNSMLSLAILNQE